MVSVKLVVINNDKVVEDKGVVLVPTADRLAILHSRAPIMRPCLPEKEYRHIFRRIHRLAVCTGNMLTLEQLMGIAKCDDAERTCRKLQSRWCMDLASWSWPLSQPQQFQCQWQGIDDYRGRIASGPRSTVPSVSHSF
jgi:hypothetical protein